MMPGVEIFKWGQLGAVPKEPGIYAWYYKPRLSQRDVEIFIASVKQFNDNGDIEAAQKTVKIFLEKHIYRFFKEDPYLAEITGSLKPRFSGELRHQSPVSDSLIKRLAEEPERVMFIRSTLDLTAPHFASPIYIGMSDGLLTRITHHKFLIERYRKHFNSNESVDDLTTDRDAGFAKRVAQRGIPPELLFVATCTMESDNGINTDIENILNRIYYPILGRN